MDNLESILSSVMSDEGLMDKIKAVVKGQESQSSSISDVVSLIAPKLFDTTEKVSTHENNINSKEITEVKTSIPFINSISNTISKNSELLIALKPYLSKERCQIINSVIKLSQIADTLKLL